jgi:hypothetical protein
MRHVNHPHAHPSELRSCVYCGGPREVLDHVLPCSKARLAFDNPDYRKQTFLVTSCKECNQIAGDRAFSSFVKKAQFIQAHREVNWDEILITAPIVARYLARIESGMYSLGGSDYFRRRSGRIKRGAAHKAAPK